MQQNRHLYPVIMHCEDDFVAYVLEDVIQYNSLYNRIQRIHLIHLSLKLAIAIVVA